MKRSFSLVISLCALLAIVVTTPAQTFTPTHSLSAPVPFAPGSYLDATINVPQNLVITSLKVRVTILYNNSQLGWLSVGLRLPGNFGFVLNDAGAGPNYVNTVFMDGAAQSCWQSPAPHTGFYTAMSPLSSTYGRMSGGNWDLHIEEYSDVTGGTIMAFELELNNGVLPVAMTSFTAAGGNNCVQLRWHTASEIDNSHFLLYRSATRDILGQLFARVNGHGTSATANDYHFTDREVVNGLTYYYQISDVSLDGTEHLNSTIVSAIPSPQAIGEIPIQYSLAQNSPNPFNPGTMIVYGLHEAGWVRLTVYDRLGREVSKLVDGVQSPNTYRIEFNASNLPSGVYYYTLTTQNFTTTRKMVLMR